jgi:hypothetical protein
MTRSLILFAALLLSAAAVSAGVDRVDISPAFVMNLGQGHSGSAMGMAVTGDLFFNRTFAVRTTVGFTKDRYFPSDRAYSEADYGFWLALAPYAELNVGNAWRPYVSLLGSFSSGTANQSAGGTPMGMGQAPVARLAPAATRDNAFSLGGSLGSKLRIAGPVSLYGEVTHFFYSSLSQPGTFTNSSIPDVTFNYDWNETPTYLSLGLSYSLDFSREK